MAKQNTNALVRIIKRTIRPIIKSAEIALKNFVVFAGSLFFERPRQRSGPLDPAGVSRILLLRYDKLGDMAVSIPVLETIKKTLPHVQIDILASERNVALIEHDRRISTIFLYRKKPLVDFVTLRNIRKRKYDLVMDLICHDSVTSVFLSQYLGRGCLRSALGKRKLGGFYHFHHEVDVTLGEHMLDVTLRSLWLLGISEADLCFRAPLHFDSGTETRIEELMRSFRKEAGQSRKFIGVNISAGAPNRWWGEENFRELVKLLAREAPEFRPLVFCVPHDRQAALRICQRIEDPPLLIPAGLDIMTAAGLISHMSALVTPDTSLTHIARNFGVPVVGLYSKHKRNTEQWRPHGQSRGLVQGANEDDIFDITPERVIEETLVVLEQMKHVAI